MGISHLRVTTPPHPSPGSRKTFCEAVSSGTRQTLCSCLQKLWWMIQLFLRRPHPWACCPGLNHTGPLSWLLLPHSSSLPGSTDPLLPSAPWCGAESEKGGKNQPAIWNLNETKFISLCCHFIFHCFDGEGTGDPRGPFCFAHRVERQEEGGGKGWQTGGDHTPPSTSPTTETTVGARMVLPSETMDVGQMQRPEEDLCPDDQGQDQNRTGREEPPQCHALSRSQIQTELASGHHRNCYYKFRWCTRGCLIFYYCGWSHEPLQQ